MQQRSRTFSWSDPAETVAGITTLPGLVALERMLAGELPYPPITQLMSMRLVELVPGRVVWEAVPGEEHYNPIGTVHAGFATTILDSAMGTAFVSTAEAGTRWTTLELKANFTRAITSDTGPVRCTGTVVHPGRTVVTTEARLEDAEGRLLAHGTSTILVLRD
ncbi:MAG: PaaI family thioesterase [Gaiella sp.]|nr:PaaI family thioesterase [Gaiella sp.]